MVRKSRGRQAHDLGECSEDFRLRGSGAHKMHCVCTAGAVQRQQRKGLGWDLIVKLIIFGNDTVTINTREPVKVLKPQRETIDFF